MKTESEIQQLIQIEAAKYGCTLMRNNSGSLKDETGRLVRYGLGHTSPNQAFKSSDLIGITEVTVTPDMVGKKVAIFSCVEVKKEDWKTNYNDTRENYQRNFIQWVNSKGGIALMTNSVDEFIKLLKK